MSSLSTVVLAFKGDSAYECWNFSEAMVSLDSLATNSIDAGCERAAAVISATGSLCGPLGTCQACQILANSKQQQRAANAAVRQ